MSSEPENLEFSKFVVEAVQQAGYKAKLIETENLSVIESATGGLKFSITMYPGNSIQLALVMSEIKNFGHADANAFNRKFRFSKAFVEESTNVVLELDWIIGEQVDHVANRIAECLEVWEQCISRFTSDLKNVEA